MQLQVGVKAFLENDKKEFLLLLRSREKYPDIGEQWDIPGGRIDPGAPLIENLRREIFEETGLKLEKEPILLCAQDILKPDKHVVRLTYRGEISGGPSLSDEHSEFAWYTVEQMRKLDHLDPYAKEILNSDFFI